MKAVRVWISVGALVALGVCIALKGLSLLKEEGAKELRRRTVVGDRETGPRKEAGTDTQRSDPDAVAP